MCSTGFRKTWRELRTPNTWNIKAEIGMKLGPTRKGLPLSWSAVYYRYLRSKMNDTPLPIEEGGDDNLDPLLHHPKNENPIQISQYKCNHLSGILSRRILRIFDILQRIVATLTQSQIDSRATPPSSSGKRSLAFVEDVPR